MQLTELEPRLANDGKVLVCQCPCGGKHSMIVPFANPVGGGDPMPADMWPWITFRWQRTGEDFATMSLVPSIHSFDVDVDPSDDANSVRTTHWHGFITNGQIVAA